MVQNFKIMMIDDFFRNSDSLKLLFALKDFQAFTASELSKVCGIEKQKTNEIIKRMTVSNFEFVSARKKPNITEF